MKIHVFCFFILFFLFATAQYKNRLSFLEKSIIYIEHHGNFLKQKIKEESFSCSCQDLCGIFGSSCLYSYLNENAYSKLLLEFLSSDCKENYFKNIIDELKDIVSSCSDCYSEEVCCSCENKLRHVCFVIYISYNLLLYKIKNQYKSEHDLRMPVLNTLMLILKFHSLPFEKIFDAISSLYKELQSLLNFSDDSSHEQINELSNDEKGFSYYQNIFLLSLFVFTTGYQTIWLKLPFVSSFISSFKVKDVSLEYLYSSCKDFYEKLTPIIRETFNNDDAGNNDDKKNQTLSLVYKKQPWLFLVGLGFIVYSFMVWKSHAALRTEKGGL